ncbi:unnamed protein product [Linum tenue]|uniref:Protein ECERIFERUM 26-like n=2 Tax=Linum tenue TaxID=586396 RepID=A0AAV0H1X7_9ROSI|nr:unnamed protein product [Linum tenue]
MVSDSPVYNVKISSVGPGRATVGEVVQHYGGLDLAMKLHYLRGVYFLGKAAAEGMTTTHIKESMFLLCNDYYMTCGRFRRSVGSGRPYMKCNDCGARFLEAQCDLTLEEWLDGYFSGNASWNIGQLVYHLPVGPELFFSPPVYLQVTKFKCGGMSLGMSWAHILGDIYTATDFINNWGGYLAGHKSNGPFHQQAQPILNRPLLPTSPNGQTPEPLSLKRVDPVGDHWVTANNFKMETFSFRLTATQAAQITARQTHNKSKKPSLFESITAAIWKSIAKIREGINEPKRVTIIRKTNSSQDPMTGNNRIAIGSVSAEFSVADSDSGDLAGWLSDRIGELADEKNLIDEAVERDDGASDYVVYGANLTFVDLAGADLYGLESNGQGPEFVCYEVQGVGDEGAVVVVPWPKSSDGEGNEGRVVTAILPEEEVEKLKLELRKIGVLEED